MVLKLVADNSSLVGPGKHVERDRWGRARITTPQGAILSYTRCTTYIDALDDKTTLTMWKQRMTARGLAHRSDILAAVKAVADPESKDGKSQLNKLCDQALEAAGAGAKASLGTTLHGLCERVDRGEMITDLIPDGQEATIDAYQKTMLENQLKVVQMETFGVNDDLRVAGTWDRIVHTPSGMNVIADIKTGSIDYSIGKFAMQLALYAHCVQYDPQTHKRSPLPGVSQNYGLLIHLPEGKGTCELFWLDLTLGWQAVELAGRVRAYRKVPRQQWVKPYQGGSQQALTAGTVAEANAALLQAINTASSEQELYALWQEHAATWQPQHTSAAAARKTSLNTVAAV